MTLYSLEGKYATALYTASIKNNTLSKTVQEVSKVQGVLAKNKDLMDFIKNPSVSIPSKKSAITEMLKKENYSATTIQFFETLALQGRLGETIKIIKAFEDIMKAHNGQIEAVITSSSASIIDLTTHGRS